MLVGTGATTGELGLPLAPQEALELERVGGCPASPLPLLGAGLKAV